MYDKSYREESLLIRTPQPNIQFRYASSKLWNSIRKKVLSKPDFDLTTKISYFKKELKALLFLNQKIGDEVEWYPSNFSIS